MNESFYQLYKLMKDMVEDFEDKDVSEPFRNFIAVSKLNCERYDRKYKKFLYRWMNERYLLFRFHKGGLHESMETITIIESFEHLLMIAIDFWDCPLTKVTIDPYIYDERIEWDTQLVQIYVKDKHWPIGYLNRVPFWTQNQGEINEVKA